MTDLCAVGVRGCGGHAYARVLMGVVDSVAASRCGLI